MCPICGTLLELAESPQAQREKVFVAKLVAEGKSKAEVKDALVAQYGPSVLALPKASGFDLSAYLVPILAIADRRDRARLQRLALAPQRAGERAIGERGRGRRPAGRGRRAARGRPLALRPLAAQLKRTRPVTGTGIRFGSRPRSPQAIVTAVCSVRARSASASSLSGGPSISSRS